MNQKTRAAWLFTWLLSSAAPAALAAPTVSAVASVASAAASALAASVASAAAASASVAWAASTASVAVEAAASAVPRGWDLRDQLASPAWRWSEPQEFDLPGARLRVQQFSTSLDLQEAARRLSNLPAGRFMRLQVAGSGLWLSGLSGAVHWLAQLGAQTGAIVGGVSSLEPRDAAPGVFDARRFAPPGARPVVQTFSRAPGRATLARLECEGEAVNVLQEVARRLRGERWRPSSESPESPLAFPVEWRREAARLSVLHEARAGRVVLTFWHRAPEAS
ncbi:hypothetical protein CDEF62S_05914 [Castellaniella defragrans]